MDIQRNIQFGQAMNLAIEVMTAEHDFYNTIEENPLNNPNMQRRLDELVDYFMDYMDKKRAELEEKSTLFGRLKERQKNGGTLLVSEWEQLSPEQQEYFQALKRQKGREDYKANKDKPNREKCPTCDSYRYIGEPCRFCEPQVVGDRENQREVQ